MKTILRTKYCNDTLDIYWILFLHVTCIPYIFAPSKCIKIRLIVTNERQFRIRLNGLSEKFPTTLIPKIPNEENKEQIGNRGDRNARPAIPLTR